MDNLDAFEVVVVFFQANNERFDFSKDNITPEELARRAYFFALGFSKIIDLITDCHNIDQILYCEQVATVLSLVDEVLLKSLIYQGMKPEELRCLNEKKKTCCSGR